MAIGSAMSAFGGKADMGMQRTTHVQVRLGEIFAISVQAAREKLLFCGY
jgi:hypothetical protein